MSRKGRSRWKRESRRDQGTVDAVSLGSFTQSFSLTRTHILTFSFHFGKLSIFHWSFVKTMRIVIINLSKLSYESRSIRTNVVSLYRKKKKSKETKNIRFVIYFVYIRFHQARDAYRQCFRSKVGQRCLPQTFFSVSFFCSLVQYTNYLVLFLPHNSSLASTFVRSASGSRVRQLSFTSKILRGTVYRLAVKEERKEIKEDGEQHWCIQTKTEEGT